MWLLNKLTSLNVGVIRGMLKWFWMWKNFLMLSEIVVDDDDNDVGGGLDRLVNDMWI